ncbi:hypothetical protein BV22DRAFT_524604 [Leucogyrophana mollusca]|uniref:Uncharacterized protein n=1 Tax=Leucogyrophana mollusca TaxID=85980 RepID=A0ACB8BG33_9AGAM|nr:hypothetical protein BV22DRAFT_524604 [Leucogyrophana mollusca]
MHVACSACSQAAAPVAWTSADTSFPRTFALVTRRAPFFVVLRTLTPAVISIHSSFLEIHSQFSIYILRLLIIFLVLLGQRHDESNELDPSCLACGYHCRYASCRFMVAQATVQNQPRSRRTNVRALPLIQLPLWPRSRVLAVMVLSTVSIRCHPARSAKEVVRLEQVIGEVGLARAEATNPETRARTQAAVHIPLRTSWYLPTYFPPQQKGLHAGGSNTNLLSPRQSHHIISSETVSN